jgi:antitoxin ParD1/3/4
MNLTLSPELKQFVEAKTGGGSYADASEVVRDALRLLAARDRAGADIETLIMVLMQQMARDAEEDLRATLAEMQARNAAKKALRDLIRRVKRDRLANDLRREYDERLDCTQGLGSERAYHRVRLPALDPDATGGLRWAPTDLAGEKLTRVEQLDGIVDELKGKLDSLSDLTEIEAMRLQMLMDRRSKAMEMLSNMMKKMSETQAAIVQNMK